jgi:2-succinyl-5-enolpyruvyl-6-hydroxy-3-cyclohexene-1-carboxylate synthase
MNPATAFATVAVDELIRCGLTDAVIAPGSRSTPLAMEFWRRAIAGPGPAALHLHVRVDERSAAFLALGLAKVSGRPVAIVCTSGTAAAHLHAAVIEADESVVPLILLTADRPPELRATGANQTIDQLKLYGGAVRWFCESGVPEERPGMNGYWRSLACRAWAAASGASGGLPGPVHINVALREPLVPGLPGRAVATAPAAGAVSGPGGDEDAPGGAGPVAGDWPEPLDGRPGGVPWTGFATDAAGPARGTTTVGGGSAGVLDVPWSERGVVVCGDGSYDPVPLLDVARAAGWPVLAEPSSGARRGARALGAYPYLLESERFAAGHRPDVIISAGRPSLSRAQLGYLRGSAPSGLPPRHIVIAQGPGRWADPVRTATDVTGAVRVTGGPARPGDSAWLRSWLAADAAARRAAENVLAGAGRGLTEPGAARDVAAALPAGGLLWAASSLPIRDLDHHMRPREGLRVLANRGASGIDGLVSAAIGAALAHQRSGGGRAAALLGDLAFVHDAGGLFLGPDEPRPDLAIVVINNDGGGIFATLEQAAFPESFERIFATPTHADLPGLAAAAGLPAVVLRDAADLPSALARPGLHVVEVRTGRTAGTRLRERLRAACVAAVEQVAGW